MIRVLISTLAALLLVALATALVGLEGKISGVLFGWRFDAPSGVVVLSALAAMALVAIFTSMMKDILRWPASQRAKGAAKKGARGLDALAKAYAMLAAGDAPAALKALARAEKLGDEQPLAMLLKADADAELGDMAQAESGYRALLQMPGYERAALRRLAQLAERAGDDARMGEALAQAATIDPKAAWAFDAALARDISRADWASARARLAQARRERRFDKARAKSAEAIAFAAEAMEARRSGDNSSATSLLDAALQLDPDFVPAIIEHARALAESGDAGGGLKRLASAKERLGDDRIDIAARLIAAQADDSATVVHNPGTDETASIDRARALIARSDASAALAMLREILADSTDAEALRLAAIAAAAEGVPAAAERFLDAARLAPAAGADLRALSLPGWGELIRRTLKGETTPPPSSDDEARLAARHGFRALDRAVAARRGALALPTETLTAPDSDREAERRDAELARAADAARAVS